MSGLSLRAFNKEINDFYSGASHTTSIHTSAAELALIYSSFDVQLKSLNSAGERVIAAARFAQQEPLS